MKLRVAGIENDSIVDGEGIRMTIFTQGCPHRCEGCHNPETWDFQSGKLMDVMDIVEMMSGNILLDGITLSGGEPFCQVDACEMLAYEAHCCGLNIWCYTGYTFEELLANQVRTGCLLEQVDVLVDGRFEKDNRSLDLYFRGSRNQRVIDVKQSLKYAKIVLYHI